MPYKAYNFFVIILIIVIKLLQRKWHTILSGAFIQISITTYYKLGHKHKLLLALLTKQKLLNAQGKMA